MQVKNNLILFHHSNQSWLEAAFLKIRKYKNQGMKEYSDEATKITGIDKTSKMKNYERKAKLKSDLNSKTRI